MKITVRLYGALKEIAGSDAFELEFSKDQLQLHEVLEALIKKAPSLSQYILLHGGGELEVRGVSILVNGRHAVFLGGGSALVKNGDVVDILPPLHGG